MNILITTNSLCFGGAEMFSLQLFYRLKKAELKVKYLIFNNDFALVNKENLNESEFKYFNRVKINIFNILGSFFNVYKLIVTNKINIIICSQPQSALLMWIIKFFLKDLKIIYISMHVYQNSDFKEKLIWFTGIPQKQTSYFFALSNFFENELITKNKVPKEKCLINRLPVDTNTFYPDWKKRNRKLFNLPQDKFIIGISTRLFKIKRVNLFIESFIYLKKNKNIVGVIFGDGPEKDNLEKIIRDNCLNDVVKIYPFTNNPSKLIPCFDLYLQTVEGPNLGLATLESFSSGVPLIMLADNQLEKAMILDTYCNKNVGRISTSKASDISKLILELFENRLELENMSLSARQLALDFYSWDNFMNKTKETFEIIYK